jgi:mono/diheme cytochrome c family protein
MRAGLDAPVRAAVVASTPMLLTITTTGKVTLVVVAGLFIAWALITAIVIPKRNPDFPSNLGPFVLVSALFLVAQLGAVYWVTDTQASAESTGVLTTTGGESTAGGETTAGGESAKGDPDAGKLIFNKVGCSSCHTLADSNATGQVGPNLDQAKPSHDLVVDRVTNGKGAMPSFKGQLDETQIENVATYVSSVAGAS